MVPTLITISILITVALVSTVSIVVLIDFWQSRRSLREPTVDGPQEDFQPWPDLPVKRATISFVFELDSGQLQVSELLSRPHLIADIIEFEVVSDEFVPKGFVILADGAPFFDVPDTTLNAESWVAGLVQLTNQKEGRTRIWAHEQSTMLMGRKNDWLDIEDTEIPRTRFAFVQFTEAMLEVCQNLVVLIQQYEASLDDLAANKLRDAPPDVKRRLQDARDDFSPVWSDNVRLLRQFLEKRSSDV